MPPKIRDLAHHILTHPEQISLSISKPAEGVLQAAYVLYDEQKPPLLKSLLEGKDIKSILIFSSTKDKVKLLERELIRAKLMPPPYIPTWSRISATKF